MVQTILEADFLSYFQLIFFEAPIYIPRTDFSGTFVASTFKTLTVLKHFARPSPFRTSPHFMRTLLPGGRPFYPWGAAAMRMCMLRVHVSVRYVLMYVYFHEGFIFSRFVHACLFICLSTSISYVCPDICMCL